jgi:hypothetical protein
MNFGHFEKKLKCCFDLKMARNAKENEFRPTASLKKVAF